MSFRLAYGTNGFGDHRLADALAVLSDLGYQGVALTLDHPHLDPFAKDVVQQTARAAQLLDRYGLAVAVETGARYVLDPWHKHEPTLVSDTGRDIRTGLLRRAIDIAADLGSEVVSLWSGILPAGTTAAQGWDRLTTGLADVLPHAARAGVTLAFEPEPGMFVARLAGVAELRSRLGHPTHLRTTLDVGHLRCNEDAEPARCIGLAGGSLAHVQIDDMRRGVHEHLELGDGEVDFPSVFAALQDLDYAGLVAVELPRHSHAAPMVAQRSLAAMTAALVAAEHLNHEKDLEASR
jgi:sugar phosphate isomerase/epimerase